MASAERIDYVTLELSVEEAEALRTLCQFVSGESTGARGLIDEIDDALREAEIDRDTVVAEGNVRFV